jgi:hypothetical protein
MMDLDTAARILAQASGLQPEQAPGLAIILKLVAHEGWRDGMQEAVQIVRQPLVDGDERDAAKRIAQVAAARPSSAWILP